MYNDAGVYSWFVCLSVLTIWIRKFAHNQTENNQTNIELTEAHSYPRWSVDSRGAGQLSKHTLPLIQIWDTKIVSDVGLNVGNGRFSKL